MNERVRKQKENASWDGEKAVMDHENSLGRRKHILIILHLIYVLRVKGRERESKLQNMKTRRQAYKKKTRKV